MYKGDTASCITAAANLGQHPGTRLDVVWHSLRRIKGSRRAVLKNGTSRAPGIGGRWHDGMLTREWAPDGAAPEVCRRPL